MTIRAESKRQEALQSKEGRKKRIKSKKVLLFSKLYFRNTIAKICHFDLEENYVLYPNLIQIKNDREDETRKVEDTGIAINSYKTFY